MCAPTARKEAPAITERFVNSCWFAFKWGLVLAVLGAVWAWPYLSDRIDEEIRSRVHQILAGHYSGLDVSVGSARLIEGHGIQIEAVSIRDPKVKGPEAELVYLDQIFVTCTTDLKEMAAGRLQVRQVLVRRPRVRAARGSDGTWSVAQLMPPPKLSGQCPVSTTIEDGTLEIVSGASNRPSTLSLGNIHLELSPAAADAANPGATTCQEVRGWLTADNVQRIEYEGRVEPGTGKWNVRGTLHGLDITPEVIASAPVSLGGQAAALAAIRGKSTIEFSIDCDPARAERYQYSVAGKVSGGRLEHEALAHPLNDLNVAFHADNQGLRIDDFSATIGAATVRLAAGTSGFGADKPMWLSGYVRRFTIDRDSIKLLPEQVRTLWEKFRPEGEIDADLELVFDGQTWKPNLKVKCLGVAFTYHRFPYQLERGTGDLTLNEGRLTLNMKAQSGSRPVELHGVFDDPGPAFTGGVTVTGGGIAFDENLMAALPSKSREVVRSLNPEGTLNFELKVWRDDARDPLVHQDLTVTLNHCSVQYDHFPYPVKGIKGTLRMVDQHWTFDRLEGTNDTGVVTCGGELRPMPDGHRLHLHFDAQRVPLEEELRTAFRPHLQKLWQDVRPQGTVDFTADVEFIAATKQLSVIVNARPLPGTTIEPISFPYRLDLTDGMVGYRDGRLTINKVRGTHGRTQVLAHGIGETLPDGRCHLHFSELNVDRMPVDRDLFLALPEQLKRVASQLRPTQPLSLKGILDLVIGREERQGIEARWAMNVEMERSAIDCGVRLEGLCGGVRLEGSHIQGRTACKGELDFSLVTYKDFVFREVRGPLWIDENRVILGLGAEPLDNGRPRPVTASLFGGAVHGSAQINLGSVARYALHGTLAQGDLTHLARETLAGPQKLKGKVLGELELRGDSTGTQSLTGNGQIRLTDADIYELPLMIALLKLFSIRAPDRTAFTKSDITFRVQGEHIYFDHINFSGYAISLNGTGEMDLDTRIALELYSELGPSENWVPVLSNILRGASQEMLKIQVGGTLANPTATAVAFPSVNEALQQIQSDLQRPSEGQAPAARGMFPWSEPARR